MEQFHNLYYSPSIIRAIESEILDGQDVQHACAGLRIANILVKKSQRKRQHKEPRHEYKNNIKMTVRKIRVADWI
jgi:hypothetical protein